MNYRHSGFPDEDGEFQGVGRYWIDHKSDEIESMGFEDEDGDIIPLADYLARRE